MFFSYVKMLKYSIGYKNCLRLKDPKSIILPKISSPKVLLTLLNEQKKPTMTIGFFSRIFSPKFDFGKMSNSFFASNSLVRKYI